MTEDVISNRLIERILKHVSQREEDLKQRLSEGYWETETDGKMLVAKIRENYEMREAILDIAKEFFPTT